MGKTPSSHIIHLLGGEHCWIVQDSEPIRLLFDLKITKITECVYTNIKKKLKSKMIKQLDYYRTSLINIGTKLKVHFLI